MHVEQIAPPTQQSQAGWNTDIQNTAILPNPLTTPTP